MSEATPITVNVEKIGEVTMVGTGPWRVRSNNGSSNEIVDANDRVANPTVMQRFSTTGFKPNANVTWAKRALAQSVVDAANAALEGETPAEEPVEEPNENDPAAIENDPTTDETSTDETSTTTDEESAD